MLWPLPPRRYACPFVPHPVKLTGKMDDPLWERAEWTDDFVDILGDSAPKPRYRTRLKMLWDPQYLTIGAELEEPHVWATLTEHDSVIFQDNDFEVFIDPDGDGHLYGELEINALNTTWDLLINKPYRVEGAAINGWEIHGLKTAVHVDGTINDPTDTDRGWTVEIAIPWTAISELARRALPPSVGDVMRINFSRVEWEHEVVDGQYRKLKKPEDNWVWSPQGVVDMHRPERWGLLEFCDGPSQSPCLPDEVPQLFAIFEAQREFRQAHGRWATVDELGMTSAVSMETTTSLLELRLGPWRLDQDARLTKVE